MIKPKSKQRAVKPPTAEVSRNYVGQKCIYDICPDIWLATPHTIAMIAAALAKSVDEPPAKLADRAMALFYESVKRVIIADYQHEVHVRNQELTTELGIETEAWIFDPLNYKYPLERDEILANIFLKHKHRSAELAGIAKNYLRAELQRVNKRLPTLDEVVTAYENWKPCNNYREANQLATRICEWHENHISESRQSAGKNSASKKKLKKKALSRI